MIQRRYQCGGLSLPTLLVVLGTAPVVLLAAVATSNAASSKGISKAPVCETRIHPKITKVTPDPVQAGQKVTIKGKNFGKKECFLGVSFGATKAVGFTYVNETKVEATVPEMKPGLTQVSILTEAGSSQYVLLIKAR